MGDWTYPTARNVVSDIVFFIYERRRIITVVSALGAVGISLLANIFGDHASDPSRCDPGQSPPFALTQTATPSAFTLGCPPGGVTYTIRW